MKKVISIQSLNNIFKKDENFEQYTSRFKLDDIFKTGDIFLDDEFTELINKPNNNLFENETTTRTYKRYSK